jgi:hypothetical protein
MYEEVAGYATSARPQNGRGSQVPTGPVGRSGRRRFRLLNLREYRKTVAVGMLLASIQPYCNRLVSLTQLRECSLSSSFTVIRRLFALPKSLG